MSSRAHISTDENSRWAVSALSYGAWTTFKNQADLEKAKELIKACRDAGVNFFDNAEVYADGEAEKIMGQAFKDLGIKRSDLVISTKLFWGGPGPNDRGLSRKHIIEGTKAQAIADRWGLMPPVVEQPEYNLFARNKGSGVGRWGTGVVGGARGSVFRKCFVVSRDITHAVKGKLETRRPHIEAASRLEPIARELGCSMAQLALAWTLRNPHVSTAIMGASHVCQVHDNVGALAVLPRLTDDVMARIERTESLPGPAALLAPLEKPEYPCNPLGGSQATSPAAPRTALAQQPLGQQQMEACGGKAGGSASRRTSAAEKMCMVRAQRWFTRKSLRPKAMVTFTNGPAMT
ncbi:hypothetical protein VOLCADRAFT_90695 [Volvox carteri f. nagariensis]|uniref:NADP-dependent oxidoreductase domain-containing protein n=1 Tax=Volvox carteri f. nagariensis TaxID=3068 RepID=D8TVH1_VOLCA|nr:uncharacterized protein VOLCADRAFT_90695 [Volvox carteri f. nagariensis]EFJ48457.1 hypothetical protein VOLCADRAFT_90695 [Volvox carteri f. nagariensis]|eukprot:XP_002950256.1 hypothetical protein VOLCADRAFT_90695 [Volvox carteri f. nagariensis]